MREPIPVCTRSTPALTALALAGLALFALVISGCGDIDEADAPECRRGELGCPCYADHYCGTTAEGTPLVCVEGLCEMPPCPPGIEGCPCLPGGQCAFGLMCTAQPGGNTCEPRTLCPAGTHGCACYADESCDPVNDGTPQRCDNGICVLDVCDRGERGCQCLPGRRCLADGDICDDGMCVEDTGQTVVPPNDPRCYTPCQDDLDLAGGGFRACSGEGLMAGCVGDALCVGGSCVDPEALAAAGQAITACRFDAVCPDFQTCIEGRCYSDCESDADCRGDRRCHRKVCRLGCTSESDNCGDNEHCKLIDGSNGFCHPVGIPRPMDEAPKQAPPQPAAISFQVGEIDVSPDTPQPFVFFDNATARAVEVVFRKAYHDYFTEEGAVRVDDGALGWMSLVFGGRRTPCAGGALRPDGSICLIVPENETLQVFMNDAIPTDAANPAWPRFSGRITATADDGTTVGFTVNYARAPKGRWSGSLVFLGDYDSSWFDEWQAGAIGLDDASNALVRRWMALRRGTITVDEFQAVMLGVANENWRSPELAARCPDAQNPNPNVGCYLYDSGRFGDSGTRILSDNLADVPIPSGIIELPFDMLIEPSAPASPVWQGRVDSTKTLHMPGDPAVDIVFDGEPDACPPAPAPCVRYIDDLAVDAVLGGRYDPPGDTRCVLEGAGRVLYERAAVPWLVPLFDDGTEPGEGERRNRVTCRDGRFPGDPATRSKANRSLSGANPYPDGRTLRRRLHLIDGAMIDQRTLFALVYEEVPSFLQAAGEPSDRAYGYLMLQRDYDEEPVGAFRPGNLVSEVPPQPLRDAETVCPADLLEEVLGPGEALDAANAGRLGMALVEGVVPPAADDLIEPDSPTKLHYLCLSTGRFDGGPNGDEPCPPDANGDSQIQWFTLDGIEDISDAACNSDIAYDEDEQYVTPHCRAPCVLGPPLCADRPGECGGQCNAPQACGSLCEVGQPCQYKAIAGTCGAQLDRWLAAGYRNISLNPTCECANPTGASVSCSDPSCAADLGGYLPDDLLIDNPNLTFYDVPDVGIVPPDSDVDDGGRQVHALCVETGLINSGAARDPHRSGRPCPITSPVEYFAVTLDDDDIAALDCQTTDGICQQGEECARVDSPNSGCVEGNPACLPGLSDEQIDDLCARAYDDSETETRETYFEGQAEVRLLRQTCVQEARAFRAYGLVTAPPCAPGAACNRKGTCAGTVAEWRAEGTHDFVDITAWQCADGRRACQRPADSGEIDLRVGKAFVQPLAARQVFRPIDIDAAEAFRYKTRFRNRAGVSVGFAPEACIPGTNAIPYCYDGDLIKHVRQRVDCAAHIYADWYDELNLGQRATLRAFLERTFAYDEEYLPGLATPLVEDGFERNYAELLTMLGDEAITRAFASRFDLAGVRLADFPGSDLEPEGIDLSGKAGFEMFSFYQGVQYFRLVLDRFFAHADVIAASLGAGRPGQPLPDGAGFVDARTATSYVAQITAAAYKKAQAWAEIAERYVGFNRPDLARHVIERAYIETYVESLVLMQVLDTIGARGDAATQDQVGIEKRNTQLRLSRAMRQMGATYNQIKDEPNFFGIPTNFVPFPALDPNGQTVRFLNAFDAASQTARQKIDIAIASEDTAFQQNRDFETDSAKFQAEMSKLKIDYDNELSEVCGTFVGDDGGIYPAIPRYAALSDQTRGLPNPCGLVGNGAIFEAVQDLSQAEAELELVRRQQQGVYDEINNLDARLEAQCGRIKRLAEWRFAREDEIVTLNAHVRRMESAVEQLDRLVDEAQEIRDAIGCIAVAGTTVGGDCPQKATGLALYLGFTTVNYVSQSVLKITIDEVSRQVDTIERDIVEREILDECEALRIDSKHDVLDVANALPELEIAALQASIDLQTKLGVIRGLYNDAASGIANREEAEALRINTEVARNDPNVRVYRNAAYIVADRHFYAALREAYAATRVFEYYTSQTYAARDDLLLIRLAGRGELNLRDYLIELEDAFREFEQEYGNPDIRLAVISLRDDVVPMLAGNVPLSDVERQARFVEFLGDVNNRDPRGYISMPFRTGFDLTSPLTANHKIAYVQADIVGQNLGDDLGRVYLKRSGTSVLRTVEGGKAFYLFPQRAAVLNASFNGRRGNGSVEFDPRIYRNERYRERPLVNTRWEMILNTIDETVNEDIDVSELKDIVLYVYYTDFTTAL